MADDVEGIISNAIARGIEAFDQCAALNEAERQCMVAAGKLPMKAQPDAERVCYAIGHRAALISEAANRIDQAIFGGDGSQRVTAQSTAQAAFDKLYNDMFWGNFGKSQADLQSTYDGIMARTPGTPSRQPAADALWDLLHNLGYTPRAIVAGAPQAPHPSGPEQPET